MDFLDYYRTFTGNMEIEEPLVMKALEQGVIVKSLRYDEIKGAVRGVIKSTDGEFYYFNYFNDELKLSKAEKRDRIIEAGWMHDRLTKGLDAIEQEEGEENEAEKAAGEGTGEQSSGVLPRVPEKRNVRAQERLTTEHHPGAASGPYTPDRPEVGRQWHEEEPEQPEPQQTQKSQIWTKAELIKSLGKGLSEQANKIYREPSQLERQFLMEELGRTPEQIDNGDVNMNPTQKVLFQRYLNKSLRNRVKGLKKKINGS